MNYLVPFLICFPFVIACILGFIRNGKVRGMVVYTGVTIMIAMVLTMLIMYIRRGDSYFLFKQTEAVDMIMLIIEILLMFVIIYLSCKYRKFPVCLLSIVQTAIVFWIEVFGPEIKEQQHILLDKFSLMMCVIVAVIGGLICVYAVGYMHGFHQHHKEFKDRRPFFFFLLFIFLGSMFGLVLSANLLWMDFFWEITSICSFLLIGYTKTEEAVHNSFRALWMNLLGGLGFAVAILYTVLEFETVNLQELVGLEILGASGAIIPVALLAFAGLTKSAQLPFSPWLLGAMVAPTPTSALLHSATMVKAGVYILLRLAPALHGTLAGTMVSFIGGFTFIAASMLAISQSDAKKVLAYSTISNLGLITACAGVGATETIWAGIFLLIFHAISKSMLFQDVGAVENSLGSRNIEDMDSLMMKLPRLAYIMMVGIAGMFLAPFGMLISKWAALKAFVDASNTLLVLFLAFGSATTMFYWMKWFGKLLGRSSIAPVKDITKKNEIISLYIHAFLMIALCLTFPLLSKQVVEPMLGDMLVSGATSVLGTGNLYVMIIMLLSVFIFPAVMLFVTKKLKKKYVITYMGGANAGDNKHFINSYGEQTHLYMTNWYMEDLFGEKKLLKPSLAIAATFLVIIICLIIGGAL